MWNLAWDLFGINDNSATVCRILVDDSAAARRYPFHQSPGDKAMRPSKNCPDCEPRFDGESRRDFMKRLGSTALAVSAAGSFVHVAEGSPTRSSSAETAVGRFYESLTDAQRKVVCMPFDHELRSKINANWHVVEPTIAELFTDEQRANVLEIVRDVTTEDGYERFLEQMEQDDSGIDAYSCAIFGNPESGDFQWELTGRHLTLRADGNSVANRAFGGPLIYGHGEEDPKHNLFYYQTKKANEVFRALDAPQAKLALIDKAPKEADVLLQGESGQFPGIRVGELSSDQKELVEETLRVLLAPYRQEDVDEAMAILKQGGGLDQLHMAFYREGDLNDDQVWDIWRVEGPSFAWHFRGAPHVHAYINIGIKQA